MEGRAVEDMTGRVVTITAHTPETFILTPVLWHYLSVNLSAKPISKIPPYMIREFESSVLGKIFSDLKDLPTAFTDFSGPAPISVEEVMEANPDAVLVWDYMAYGLKEINYHGLLEITGDGGDKTKLFKLLSGLTGREAWSASIWERFHREMNLILGEVKDCDNPVKVAILGGPGYNLWGGKSQRYLFSNIQKLCGRNVVDSAANSDGVLNVENLLSLDPEVLLLNPYILDQTDIKVEDIYADPRLAGLKAILEKRVYHMPLGGSRLEGPVEVPLSMLWLLNVLHPDWDSQLDLRAKIRETYFDIYGYEMSDKDIDNWLRLSENGASAYYERFRAKAYDS